MQDKVVSLKLNVASVNVILNALAQRPFQEVVGIVTAIRMQADAQLSEVQQPEPGLNDNAGGATAPALAAKLNRAARRRAKR